MPRLLSGSGTVTGTGALTSIAPGADGQVLTSTGAGSPPAFESVSAPLSNRNRLINGDFQISQLYGTDTITSLDDDTGANNDNSYILDRWKLVSEGNDIVDINQSNTAPTNQLYSMRLDVETVNKKFGIAQTIEQQNCIDLIGNAVTFSFKAKVSATTKLDNVKAGIIAWSSTADAVTDDIVSAWGAEGTNPTLASNLTFENTPANLSVTTSWATYSVSANIDTSSTTNIIVFIWSDVSDTTAGDFLYITDCQLEVGSSATTFERRDYASELARCQWYYQVLFNPGRKNIDSENICISYMHSNGYSYGSINHPNPIRDGGTASIKNKGEFQALSSAGGGWTQLTGVVGFDALSWNRSAIYFQTTGTDGYAILLRKNNSSATGNDAGMIILDSEL
tara:strand:- start:223 stop:1404 length:1182 start_codon:yes stop_codon:yes gene_type:complete